MKEQSCKASASCKGMKVGKKKETLSKIKKEAEKKKK